MTASLPHDLASLVLMVFLLGLRHGMDPDHLATVLAGAEVPMGFGVAIIAVTSFAVAIRLACPAPA